MNAKLTLRISRIVSGFLSVCLLLDGALLEVAVAQTTAPVVQSAPVVPGTGVAVKKVGDDFEDVNWKFNHYFPKSSKNLDKRERSPGGDSENDRWYEGIKRGQPDVIRRVATPTGGLAGSQGELPAGEFRGRPSPRARAPSAAATSSGHVPARLR